MPLGAGLPPSRGRVGVAGLSGPAVPATGRCAEMGINGVTFVLGRGGFEKMKIHEAPTLASVRAGPRRP